MATEFTVIWSNVVYAETAEEAVKICAGMLADPENVATYFRVINEDNGHSTMKDYERVLFPERFKED